MFTQPLDIVNRALQRCGVPRIASMTEDSPSATEANFLYDKLRRAELRRNVWRFAIRRVATRAVGTALSVWDSTVTYAVGALVQFNSVNYISIHATNLNQEPDTSPTYWSVYNGNTTTKVTFSAWSNVTTYAQGAVVTGSDNLIYLSLVGSNTNHDPTTDTAGRWTLYFGNVTASAWDSTTTYSVGELVFPASDASLVYASTMNGNDYDPQGGIGWVLLTATGAPLVVTWPAGTGPVVESATKNIFVLPNGYLREAPQDPKAGQNSFLGFPSNLLADDYVFEGPYLISMDSGPLVFRFSADVTDVTLMDDLFCEGLASRLALELCERLTQSATKLAAIASEYKQFMGEARTINGIETSATQPPLDDYIATRW